MEYQIILLSLHHTNQLKPKDFYERLAEAKKAAKLEADVKRVCEIQKPFTIIGNFIIPNN